MANGDAPRKIQTLDALAETLEELRDSHTIVHCHGVFDLQHIGHVRYLAAARRLGGANAVLVVTLTPDHLVNKGPNRPAFTAEHRAEHLAALHCVDFVAINTWATAVPTIQSLQPHIFAKGSEFRDESVDATGAITAEREAVEALGGRLELTDEIVFSSSTLLNRHVAPERPEVRAYLDGYLTRHGPTAHREAMAAAAKLRMLCVGESIIDCYQQVAPLGKSSKDPALAVADLGTECHAGGILAVAYNAAAVCARVTAISQRDAADRGDVFALPEHLQPGAVVRDWLQTRQAGSLRKTRICDAATGGRLLEVYSHAEVDVDPQERAHLLRARISDPDIALVVDFGHGLLDAEAAAQLCGADTFLAVNTQANAGNHGFNCLSKYRRADLICVSEPELRLDARDAAAPLEALLRGAAARTGARVAIVTRGGQGCLVLEGDGPPLALPALGREAVDCVGAGDTFLAVVAPLVRAGAPGEVAALMGSIAAAAAVATPGHARYLDRTGMIRHADTLLK